MKHRADEEDAREMLSRYFHDKTPPRNPDHQKHCQMLDRSEKKLYDILPGSSTPPDKSLLELSTEQFRGMGYSVKSPNLPNPPRSRRLKQDNLGKQSKISKKSKARIPKASTSKALTPETSRSKASTSKVSTPKISASKGSKGSKANYARRKLPRRGENTKHRPIA